MPLASPSSIHDAPSTSFAPAVFVFEKRPRWSWELKQQLAANRLFIRTYTTPAEILPALGRFPASLVVLHLDDDPPGCLGLLRTVHEASLRASFIAIVSDALAELEWPLREAGVGSLVANTIRGEEFTRVCMRILELDVGPTTAQDLARFPAAAPCSARPPTSDLRPPTSDLRPPTSDLRPPTSDL
jgi:hypothetical protein